MSGFKDRPLMDFLATRSAEQLDRLYTSPAAVLATFRQLPKLSQMFFMKAIWLRDSSKQSDWRRWTALDHQDKVAEHVTELRNRGILYGTDIITLHEDFRRSFLKGIKIGFHRASEFTIVTECSEKIKKAANKDLGKKANERWECILHYLALPSQQSEQGVSSTTKALFRSAGLTSSESGDSGMFITSAGFQFLLLSRTEQIWTYLLHYLRMQEASGGDVVALLTFLLRLTLCSVQPQAEVRLPGETEKERQNARPLLIDESWPEQIKEFFMHLRELGLIFIRKRKDGYFFVTPLLYHLAVAAGGTESALEKHNHSGFLVVETNYRIYAYTDSNLQLAILSTFTEMLYRFNDMSVGILSRESVRRAFQVGITAAQIISYLRSNAHPISVLTSNNSDGTVEIVPVTVADQIHLWEDERQRIASTNATLYSAFDSEQEYLSLKEYAQSQGVLLWHDDRQRLVIVTEEGHEQVKSWWRMNHVGNP